MDKSGRKAAGDATIAGNHFFKIMIPGCAEKLRIPKAFITRRLNGVGNRERVKLRIKGETWDVKVSSDDEEMWLEKGWEEFVQDNEIRLGDVVVFDHMGNMVFDVMLFDPSACEKDCSSSTKNVTTATNKMKTVKKGDPLKEAEAYKTISPHFVKQITHTDLDRGVCVPFKFAESNGLCRNGRKAILRDRQRNNSGNVYIRLESNPRPRVVLGRGTVQFLKANDVQVGDVCVFELDPIAKEKGRVVFDIKIFKGQRGQRNARRN
ncbi:hypothetical protein Scep_000505 [Stephania cephalantha]|uniref:TF-B3 domain-containing protein n=1 Tax=Stephania cephalantha TaxID=152367 RepID=A0AAP0LAD6_9MAGN